MVTHNFKKFEDVKQYVYGATSQKDMEHRYSVLGNLYGFDSEQMQSEAMKNAFRHTEKRINNGKTNITTSRAFSAAGTNQMRAHGIRQFLGNLTPEEFDAKRRDIEAASKRKTIQVPTRERLHVESELNTNLTDEEWKRGVVIRPIGNYSYTVVVYGFNNFRIIGRKALK